MKVAITAVSFTLACGLTFATLSAQGQPGQPTQPGQGTPGQPGQPTQPGQGTPGQPTQPGPGTPGQLGQPTQPGQETPRPGQPGAPTHGAATDREVTFTGCVARDTSAPVATGQATDAFLLTHARPATGAGAATSPTTGGARGQDQPGAANVGQEYRLMAMGKVSLREHLNHQVRVTGTVMGSPAMPGTGANQPPAGTPGAAVQTPGAPNAGDPSRPGASLTQAPMFHVTALTMVSATCETK